MIIKSEELKHIKALTPYISQINLFALNSILRHYFKLNEI